MNWNEYLAYDETSPSCLRWVRPHKYSKMRVGDPAGCLDTHGYYAVKNLGELHAAHRIIWELHNGPIPDGMEIDHKDVDKTNNRIDNLRLATKNNNNHNRPRFRNNVSGYKGVSWYSRGKCWAAYIAAYGTRKFLGYFDLPEEAAAAYNKAAGELHGEFARS